MSIVMAVAPHADDETLGCGGTLLYHRHRGDEIHWVIATTISKEIGYRSDFIKKRNEEILDVAAKYGFSSVYQSKNLATTLDQVPKKEIVAEFKEIVDRVKPDTIYLPFRYDAHDDHKITYDAFIATVKPFRAPYVKNLRVYETRSETEIGNLTGFNSFTPNLWIDITKFLDKKIEIMKMYESEIQKNPYPRSEESLRALAKSRGTEVMMKSAESFMSIRELL